MNELNEIRGLKLEIKSLTETLQYYKSQLEVTNFKLTNQKFNRSDEIAALNKKILQLEEKSLKTQSKAIVSKNKEIAILNVTIRSLSTKLEKLKDKPKVQKSLREITSASNKKIKDIELTAYFVGLIEEIINDGELMPSVAERIRGYTKKLTDSKDFLAIQPLMEDLINTYNCVKRDEKINLKLKK